MFDVEALGLTTYAEALAIQEARVAGIRAGTARSTFFLTEHHPVLTLGANFHAENLRLDRADYAARGIELVTTNRGGDVTFHGPGQLVAYPVFDLTALRPDLHWWLRTLEAIVIEACAEFSVVATRFPPHTGVWVGERKVCAMGIAVRKWVSMHGLAINLNNDLSPFETIVPCGIADYGVTSLSAECGRDVGPAEFGPVLVEGFRRYSWPIGPT